MGSLIYPSAIKRMLAAYLNGGADIRAALLMTNTTADTDVDGIDTIADIGNLDECDDSGYARMQLDNETVLEDTSNDRAVFDASDLSFTGLNGDSSRNIQGVLLYKYVDGTDENDEPIAFIEFGSAIPKEATQIDIPWDSAGILYAKQADSA